MKNTLSNVLRIKEKQGFVFIHLNRPQKRNALSPNLIRALLKFFQKKSWPAHLTAVVLSGEGKGFCSGADLKWLANEALFTDSELEKLSQLLEAIETCPLPVIILAHGFVIGGGLGLVSVADITIAENKTKFCFSEAKLGLVPSIISPFVLKKIGFSQAKFLILSGREFSTLEAKQAGLLHFTGSKKECESFLQNLLTAFKTADKKALVTTKAWLNKLSSLPNLHHKKLKAKAISIISQARKTNEARGRIKKLLK